MIQKTQKQTKLLQLTNLRHKYYQMMTLQIGINSLNSKKREIFSVVHTWAEDYIKHDENNAEPVYIFLSSTGGTDKSYLVKVKHNTISKVLFYHCKDLKKPKVLFMDLHKCQ